MFKTESVVLLSADENLNQDIRQFLQEISNFSLKTFSIITQDNLAELLERKLSDSICLINLCDIHQKQLQSILSTQTIPIITLTDHQQQGMQTLTWGAVDYLDKSQLSSLSLEKSLCLAYKYNQYRYQTQQALERSEAKFRAFFEQTAIGMAIASLRGNILEVNQKLCELSGYSEAELLEKTLLELTEPDDRDITLESLQKLLRDELNCYSLEKRYIHHDGKAIWTQVTTTLVKNNQDEPDYLMVIVEDIQEHKKAEEQLGYRLRLETAIANVSQSLIRSQLANIEKVLEYIGIATHASRAYLVRFDDQGQFASMTHEWCAEGIEPDKEQFQNVDLSNFNWWINKLIHHQNIIISELNNLPLEAQAEKQYLQSINVNSVLAIPIFNYHDQLWGQLGLDTSNNHFKQWSDEDVYLLRVVGDMLYRHYEQVEAIQHQLKTHRRLRLLSSVTTKIRQSLDLNIILETAVKEIRRSFKAERVIFYRFNGDGTGKVVNEALIAGIPSMINVTIMDQCAWELCREKYQEGYVHIVRDLPHEDFVECYANLLRQYDIYAQIIVPILITKINDNSSHIWGLLCVQMCRQPRQWTTEEVELLRQLSDQLGIALFQAQLREQEIIQKQELARSNAELEQFAYIASHDLRQPLQIVADFAKLLQRRYANQLGEKANQYINHIVLGTQQMEQQISDLLQYSRVGRKEKVFELTPVQEVIQQAIANLQREIETTQAQISIIGEMPTIKADKIQLVQLFQNLIDNGIKYRREIPPQIQIEAERRDNHWLFSVKDQGIGIDSAYFKRIFQIFQRLHTQEEYQGTGIGLAICQRIIKRHGGEIWLESCLGEGTTFYFTIPMQD